VDKKNQILMVRDKIGHHYILLAPTANSLPKACQKLAKSLPKA
jgi:hypothetical protein